MRGGDFWSRRKARVAAEKVEEVRRSEEAALDAEARSLEEKSDADILEQFGLPDPDELMPGDGIAGFMRREIPERLRRRAMRKLWRSNPVLACVDGLNDYDGDFTAAATDSPGVKTAYQLGQGMRAHVEALAREAEEKANATTPDRVNSEPETPQDTAFSAPASEAAEEASGNYAAPDSNMQRASESNPEYTTKVVVEGVSEVGTPWHTEEHAERRPRRMRFRFEGGE